MQKKQKDKRFFVDLFSGCGGMSLGLEESGFRPLLFSELSPDAAATYLANRTGPEFDHLRENTFNWPDVKKLVATLDNARSRNRWFAEVKERFDLNLIEGELPLLVGGPPCQGFSGLGHRRSYSVERHQLPSNLLYQDMIFLISQLKPKIFLFENVKGLLSAKWTTRGGKGEIWRDIYGTFLKELGDDYLMPAFSEVRPIRSADFGVPQNRPRILFVGVRRDVGLDHGSGCRKLEFLPSSPVGIPRKPPDLKELLSDLAVEGLESFCLEEYPLGPKTNMQRRMRLPKGQPVFSEKESIQWDTVKRIRSKVTDLKFSRHSPKVRQRFLHMLDNEGQYPEWFKTKKFSQKILPAKWGEKGPSITVTSMPDDYIHYELPRTLSVREWARLQLFPDWYEFRGNRTTGGIRRAGNPRQAVHDREVPKYTQIGNAVPVKLAYEMGNHFLKILRAQK